MKKKMKSINAANDNYQEQKSDNCATILWKPAAGGIFIIHAAWKPCGLSMAFRIQIFLNLRLVYNQRTGFSALSFISWSLSCKKAIVFLFLLFCVPVFSQTPKEIKKEAEKLYEDGEYTRAYKLYAQLVSNFPKEPEYNYRLGVCMLYSEPDKKKCIPYLKQAATNGKEAPKDVNFYLGKAYHINYLFDEALAAYNEFKKTASASLQKKLQVDQEINACNNGKKLLSNLTDVVVQNKKELNEADYFRSYDLRSIGGKLLVKPEDFKTPIDKKKKEKSIVFLPRNSNVVYFSSYGESPENGKDIYTAFKLPGGNFSKPEKLKGINTPADEDYPFLHPDGVTLYFASKGYNSMGGYDIFRSRYNESSGTWSPPENLEFPINSPDDDFLFVTDSLQQTAYFSTGRQSPPGKIDVLKVKTERKPIDVIAVDGTVTREKEDQSVLSVINVKNIETNIPLGMYNADEAGKYSLVLPNGSRLMFTVETPGMTRQSQEVMLPLITASRPCRQIISYEQGKLKIENRLDDMPAEDNYRKYLDIIEKKAKLEVNEGENKLQLPAGDGTVAAVTNPAVKKENRPQLVDLDSASTKPNTVAAAPPADFKAEAKNARKQADEAKQAASQLRKDAKDAYATAKAQTEIADKKKTEGENIIKTADAFANEDEKERENARGRKLIDDSEKDRQAAVNIENFAKSLEEDAAVKTRQADLNDRYAREIENMGATPNKEESLKNIQKLKEEIAGTGPANNNSDKVIEKIKAETAEKEKDLAANSQRLDELKAAEQQIRTAITDGETRLDNAKKKQKEKISAEITEKKNELAVNLSDQSSVSEKVNTLTAEIAVLKKETELTEKLKNHEPVTIAGKDQNAPTQPVTESTASVSAPATAIEPFTADGLKEKYAPIVPVKNRSDKNELEKSTNGLKTYNEAISKQIAENKTALQNNPGKKRKEELLAENKKLNAALAVNNKAISDNEKSLAAIPADPAEKAVAGIPDYTPVTATNPAEAREKLDALSKKLEVYDNVNFDFNGYQDPQAQALKVDADTRINEAVEKQKKLKEQVESAKSAPLAGIGAPAAAGGKKVDELHAEMDKLHTEAVNKRKEAMDKDGPEKDKLIQEARELEKTEMNKHLEALNVGSEENKRTYKANTENINGLIGDKKASAEEVQTATRLNEEASVAFKQAAEIRKEAESQQAAGARIGILTNAEEKEAEALIKQQEAVQLLTKSNPTYKLKTPDETASAAGEIPLDQVNKGLDDLVAIKLQSYQKLYEANETEIAKLNEKIAGNKTISNTPSAKTESIAAAKKVTEAVQLKSRSDAAGTPPEKLKYLTASIKKQNEAVKQLSALNNTAGAEIPVVATKR
jgi:hypothetical protein